MLGAIFSWAALRWLLILVYVPACIGLIAIVLLQKGKGTGFAGAFGIGGGSDAVFGPRASRSLPVRLTYTFATIFIVLALTLSFLEDKIVRGDAPELVSEEAVVESGLMDEGLGSAYSGADAEGVEGDAEAAPAEETAPVEEADPTEETAPDAEGAPADGTVAPEAEGTEAADSGIDAAEETPEATDETVAPVTDETVAPVTDEAADAAPVNEDAAAAPSEPSEQTEN